MNANLKDELVAILMESAPLRTEVLLTTGEQFDGVALELARTYMRADGEQRAALTALAKLVNRTHHDRK